MLDKKTGCYIGVISHLREKNVPALSALAGNVTWYVGKGEKKAYQNAGAEFVVESGKLCESRNAILKDAFKMGVPAVELSDDLKKIQHAYWDGDEKKARPMSLHEAIQLMLQRMTEAGLYLGGVAPTANLFYFNEKIVSKNLFIVGDFIVVRPCKLFFDEKMRLKEDYDYTLQHLTKYGGVLRCNDILATFLHRTNAGGACADRTSALEQESIAYLKKKWPKFIKDNSRRKDEVLMKFSPTN